jgi:two-component system, OmpR family, sensor histidine kinase CiaH
VSEGARSLAGPSVRVLSVRVALAATAIVGVAYLVIAVAVAAFITNSLTAQVDANLSGALNRASSGAPIRPPGDGGSPDGPGPDRPFGAPTLMWIVASDGTVTAVGADTSGVTLPAGAQAATDPRTVTISGQDVRIRGVQVGEYHVVVGQTLGNVSDTQSTLVAAEIGIGAALLIVVFLGAVAIGRRVAGPIEHARQRQLEFTADASHELRTPLSVIEAQTSLALARDRPEAWYRTAFARVDAESRRMRRLVDDMLWLARFDATRGQPNAEPVDVNILATQTVDRFRIVAEAHHLTLALHESGGTSIVTVPPEWLDRLVGVLLDNACKYSPEGGSVTVSVADEGRRVRLTVDDSGPGIPADQRERVFDRFHRATDAAGGAGLGLAIGDAIVRATNGRWQLGVSPHGGASVSVSWPRSLGGQREGRLEASRADGQA